VLTVHGIVHKWSGFDLQAILVVSWSVCWQDNRYSERNEFEGADLEKRKNQRDYTGKHRELWFSAPVWLYRYSKGNLGLTWAQPLCNQPAGDRLLLFCARSVVTFPSTEHHHLLSSIKLCCSLTIQLCVCVCVVWTTWPQLLHVSGTARNWACNMFILTITVPRQASNSTHAFQSRTLIKWHSEACGTAAAPYLTVTTLRLSWMLLWRCYLLATKSVMIELGLNNLKTNQSWNCSAVK